MAPATSTIVTLLLLLLSIIVIFIDANCCLHMSCRPCSYRELLFQSRHLLMMLVASCICYHRRKARRFCFTGFGARHLRTLLTFAASISLLSPLKNALLLLQTPMHHTVKIQQSLTCVFIRTQFFSWTLCCAYEFHIYQA